MEADCCPAKILLRLALDPRCVAGSHRATAAVLRQGSDCSSPCGQLSTPCSHRWLRPWYRELCPGGFSCYGSAHSRCKVGICLCSSPPTTVSKIWPLTV